MVSEKPGFSHVGKRQGTEKGQGKVYATLNHLYMLIALRKRKKLMRHEFVDLDIVTAARGRERRENTHICIYRYIYIYIMYIVVNGQRLPITCFNA